MTKRKAMTPARKARILKAHNCKCWRCNEAFENGEKVEFDHKIALARGGTDDDENIGPAHVDCHKLKTFGTKARRLGSDIFEIAKTKRLAKKHKEPRKPNHRFPSRGFNNSGFKKKLNGTVVRRESK